MNPETSDQVGTDLVPAGPRPWERPHWLRARGAELLYTALSWPYLIAIVLTVFYILRPDLLTIQSMGGAWVVAFGRREYANYMAQRQQGSSSRPQGGIG